MASPITATARVFIRTEITRELVFLGTTIAFHADPKKGSNDNDHADGEDHGFSLGCELIEW
ncbi:hypothetical protein WU87_12535 [Corynebacterium minutissimum]|uniref:Uncharacterized protein n=1 Tax=Corynebacterium minutissimum TaxID=38301 RepID=A0ACC4U7Z4_9CORY|nr:hypothetical protein WU87_12535 [Corynebacterium minutissimum]